MSWKGPDAGLAAVLLAVGAIGFGALAYVVSPASETPDSHPRLPAAGDPPHLVAATLFGGSQREQIRGAVVDAEGNVFIAGRTESPRLRTTEGVFQRRFGGGGMDAFVAKLGPDLKTIHWLSYFGGNGYEVAYGIALAPDGSVVLAGRTSSTNLPTTEGVCGPAYSGGDDKKPYFGGDAFVCRIAGDGSAIQACSYYGGRENDFARHLALDAGSGRIAIAGSTRSRDLSVTKTPFGDRHHGGSFDAFVAVLSGDLKTLEFASYLGGGADDRGQGLALSGDEVSVTGWTASAGMRGFPQKGKAKSLDVWVARIDLKAKALLETQRIGGPGDESPEQGSLRLVDDRLLVSGYRAAGVIPGPWSDAGPGGGVDAFLAILDRKSLDVSAALRIGGSRGETVFGPASVATDGRIWICGDSNSRDFPLTLHRDGLGRKDPKQAFAAVLGPKGKVLRHAWLFGGAKIDTARGCVATPLGGVIVFGQTTSSDFPVTAGAAQMRHGGRIDGFLAHFR